MKTLLAVLLLSAISVSCDGGRSGSSSPAPATPVTAPATAPATVDGRPREADDIEQALLQARSWTERQVAPSFPDFEKRFKLGAGIGNEADVAELCNDLDSGTCVWRDHMGGLHLNIGFTLMDAQGVWITPQRRLTHCDVWDKSIPAKELPIIGKWFTCNIYDENRDGRGREWPAYRP